MHEPTRTLRRKGCAAWPAAGRSLAPAPMVRQLADNHNELAPADKTGWLSAWQEKARVTRREPEMDWIFLLPSALMELSLRGWINVGFVAVFLSIAAVAAILTRVPKSKQQSSASAGGKGSLTNVRDGQR